MCLGQIDSGVADLQTIPTKYFRQIDNKIELYSSRITKKTEKTLIKLSRWEVKVKGLLQKASPEISERLFGNNQPTFTSLLQHLKQGESLALTYKAPYNKYRDELNTSLKYLNEQKKYLDSNIIKKVTTTSSKVQELSIEEDNSEALQQFIQQRKKQLIEEAIKHIGKCKYLTKINKEAYYYVETLKNYKEIFEDSKKSEELAKAILNKIPAFKRFMQKNNHLASMFGQLGVASNTASAAGLQTRASVQSLIQDRFASGGSNAQEVLSQNIQQAQAEFSKLKDKTLNPRLGTGGTGELPDFKPNSQKTKTFLQRIEYCFDVQFAKNTSLIPTTSSFALSIGYKINDKSIIGVGGAYKVGIGEIRDINITHQGIGLRSFIDWKLKKQIFVTGGYELNHNAQFKNIRQLQNYDSWQRSALIGMAKKINVKSKWFKATKIQLLYDFLSQQHVPVSQPIIFRMGYCF